MSSKLRKLKKKPDVTNIFFIEQLNNSKKRRKRFKRIAVFWWMITCSSFLSYGFAYMDGIQFFKKKAPSHRKIEPLNYRLFFFCY